MSRTPWQDPLVVGLERKNMKNCQIEKGVRMSVLIKRTAQEVGVGQVPYEQGTGGCLHLLD